MEIEQVYYTKASEEPIDEETIFFPAQMKVGKYDDWNSWYHLYKN